MLTAAIVLYQNDPKVLSEAIDSFLKIPLEKKLYLIDNSITEKLRALSVSPEISYIHTGSNLGFGKGHNLIINELEKISSYHLVLNPDASFGSDVLPLLIDYLNTDNLIGIIAPKILYPNGNFQKSIRRFPKIGDLLIRRIPGLKLIFNRAYKNANYLNKSLDNPIEVEAVSGCFQVFRTSVFVKIGGFDPRYFMYMEDLDICRQVHNMGFKVVYFPNVNVQHHSAYGSKKSLRLLKAHIKSMIKYFIKWKT